MDSPKKFETLELLEAAAREKNYCVSADGRLSESAAASLLGVAAGTLRNRRAGDRPLPFYRVAGRITYRLADLAAYIDAARAEF